MSLSLALNNALSGLKVNQLAMSVLSNNIANANTEGYSRQVVDQSPVILDGIGSGVRIDDISRKVDKYLDRSIQREKSNVGQIDRVADYYQRIQVLLGEPGGSTSIDEYISNFFDSVQALAETPERVSFQATVVNSAESLAREVSGLAESLEDLRMQSDRDIKEGVNAVNTELQHLDTLNIAINRAAALGTSTAGLLDERDKSLEKLSEYMNVQVFFQDSGAVNVFTANGIGLVDEDIHEVSYRAASGIEAFISGTAVNPLQVLTFNDEGVQIREPDELISGGVGRDIVSKLSGGKLQGLHEVRDQLIPDILSQLDMLASRLRDQVNAVHNQGTGFPPATDLNGTRLVQASQPYDWSGKARIAVLNPDGTPASSTYGDETATGYRPLTLDFDFLDSGLGAGVPTTQTIIDEINNHFNAPPVKAEVNNLNNIQLVSDNKQMPQNAPPTFTFDLDLENISGSKSTMWVTNVTVLDDTATNITAGGVTDTIPRVALDPLATYGFTAGSDLVTISSLGPNTLAAGDHVYLNDSGAMAPLLAGGSVNSNQVVGYFEVVNVLNSNQFQVRIAQIAGSTVTDPAGAPVDALPPYHEVEAGEKERTRNDGTITTNLSLNTASAYYDISVEVGVLNGDPDNPHTDIATLTYRVYNRNTNLLNDRYDISALSGNGQRAFPTTPHQYILAKLVDANGNELPSVNGDYGTQSGYLKLEANPLNGEELTIAIDEMDSKQEGTQTLTPTQPGTGRQFSHYFELNNFFKSNKPTTTGDTIAGSAINMAVEQRIIDTPSLVSTGNLQLSNQPSDPDATPLYTYERFIGDNSVAQKMAKAGIDSIAFDAAGGIPRTSVSLGDYAGQILANIATNTVSTENQLSDNMTLLSGFQTRSDSISGVNLDEELANTVIYQNAYSASARVITVTNDLFGELLGVFN